MRKSWLWALAILGALASPCLAGPQRTSDIDDNPDYDCQCGWYEGVAPGAVWFLPKNELNFWAKARAGTSLSENNRVWSFQVEGFFSSGYFNSSHPLLGGLAPEIKFVPVPGRFDPYFFGGPGLGLPGLFVYATLGAGLEFFPNNSDKFLSIFLEAQGNLFLNSESTSLGPAFVVLGGSCHL